jgi:hypothetical protein
MAKSQHDHDNRSRQLNDEHPAFWQSRGYEDRPDDWRDRDRDRDDD